MLSTLRLAVLASLAAPVASQIAWWGPPQAWFPRPSDREDQVVLFDAARGVTVLFGGRQFGFPSAYVNDTWTWDGVQWQQVATTGPGNAPGACGAYDSLRQRFVLRAGDATWEWDGAMLMQRTAGTPPARTADKMAFDPVRGECVLFGTDGDTWTWNGQQWTRHQNTAPTGMLTIGLAFDPQRQRVLRCGGVNSISQFATWTWDGAAWHLEQPTVAPAGRRGFGLFDDGLRVLLYSGDWGLPFSFSDLWAWNGSDWQQLAPVGVGPAARYVGCTYDLVRRRAVVTTGNFGGFSQFTTSELFEYGPTTPDKTDLGSGGPGPGGGTFWLSMPNGVWPAIGTTIILSVQVLPIFAAAPPPSWLAFSTSSQSWGGAPLPRDLGPFGAPGSMLWIDPMTWMPMVGQQPRALATIPADAGLIGVELFLQALVPLPGFNPLGASTTNGLRVRVGRL